MMDLYLKTSHMIQSFVLGSLYAFLPFLIVMGRYRISVLMGGALLIFSVKMWTAVWQTAQFFDQSIVVSFFPTPGELTLQNVFGALSGEKTLTKYMALNFVGSMMYMVMPVILTLMFSVGGYSAGKQLDSVMAGFSGRLAAARVRIPKVPKR